MAAFTKRTGQAAQDYFAIGDAETILSRIAAYVDAGASKFILRPMARDEAGMLAATRQFIEQVLPKIASSWPKPEKNRNELHPGGGKPGAAGSPRH